MSQLIVGGTKAEEGQFPWQVYVYIGIKHDFLFNNIRYVPRGVSKTEGVFFLARIHCVYQLNNYTTKLDEKL